MNTIEIPESHRCVVIGVCYRMHCNKCNLVWDIYVPIEADGPPDLWDVCRNCLPKLQEAVKKTSNEYEYKYMPIMVKYPYLNKG